MDAPAALQPWLNRKGLYFSHQGSDPEFLYAPDLGERVAKELLIMKPVYDIFWKAQDTAGAESIHSTTALGLGEQ